MLYVIVVQCYNDIVINRCSDFGGARKYYEELKYKNNIYDIV